MSTPPEAAPNPSHFLLESKRWPSIFFKSLQELYSNGSMRDVYDMELMDRFGESVPAHRIFLAATCPAIQKCLLTKHKQLKNKSAGKVYFPEISVAQWRQVLDFLYNGTLRASGTDVRALHRVAGLLGVEELELLCKAVMEQTRLQGEARSRDKMKANYHKRKGQRMGSEGEEVKRQRTDGGTLSAEEEDTVVHEDAGYEDSVNASQADVVLPNRASAKNVGGKSKKGKKTGYECCLCRRRFQYGQELFTHERMHRHDMLNPDGSRKSLNPKMQLPEELRVKYIPGLVNHTCKICDKVLTNELARKAHERSHSQKPFKCPDCPASFHFPATRDHHRIRVHGFDSAEFPCGKCDQKFGSEALLNQHNSHVHKLKQDPPVCAICKEVVNGISLKDHKKKCHSERYECEICGKKMRSEQSLKDHMNIHSDNRPHVCKICDRTFSHKGSLYHHKKICQKQNSDKDENMSPEKNSTDMTQRKKASRVMSLERRTCPVCQEVMTSDATLGTMSKHIKEQHGDCKFQCGVCDKVNDTLREFWRHNRTHVERKFACDLCEKSYTRAYDLQLHKKLHTEKRSFVCYCCQFSYTNVGSMYSHGYTIHGLSFHGLYWLERTLCHDKKKELLGSGQYIRYEAEDLVIEGQIVQKDRILIGNLQAQGGTSKTMTTQAIELKGDRKLQVMVVRSLNEPFGPKFNPPKARASSSSIVKVTPKKLHTASADHVKLSSANTPVGGKVQVAINSKVCATISKPFVEAVSKKECPETTQSIMQDPLLEWNINHETDLLEAAENMAEKEATLFNSDNGDYHFQTCQPDMVLIEADTKLEETGSSLAETELAATSSGQEQVNDVQTEENFCYVMVNSEDGTMIKVEEELVKE